jgi:hypothetical protein
MRRNPIAGKLGPDWQVSSYTGTSSCVECRRGAFVEVRDSKNRTGPVLQFETPQWEAFLYTLKHGGFVK